MTICSRLLLAVSAMFFASSAAARVVAPAKIVIVSSPDGSALLRIDPGLWDSSDRALHATASVFRYDPTSKSYRLRTTFALRNLIAPDRAIINNDATYIATCDDWDALGCTPNAIVIYGGSGEFLKAWSLEDIFSPAEIQRFGPFFANTPSRRWRGDFIQFFTDSKGPMLSIPWRMDAAWEVGLRVDLKTLTITRTTEQWLDLQSRTIIPAPKE